MRMVQSHVYTRQSGICIRVFPSCQSRIVHTLEKGDWLGVVRKEEGWLYVIGFTFQGWVAEEDVESKSPFNLHAHRLDPFTIRYFNEDQDQPGWRHRG